MRSTYWAVDVRAQKNDQLTGFMAFTFISTTSFCHSLHRRAVRAHLTPFLALIMPPSISLALPLRRGKPLTKAARSGEIPLWGFFLASGSVPGKIIDGVGV